MSPQFIVLLVLAVVVVIGAGIYFQPTESSSKDKTPKEGPDSPGSTDHDGDGTGGSDGGAGGDGGGD